MDASVWLGIVAALESRDVDERVKAASHLQAESTADDVPALLALLNAEDFFVREAAAWPLAEISGPAHLPALLQAYQRGFNEGHDNDGFTAALLEIPWLFPVESRQALEDLARLSQEPLRGHAEWLLEFCAGPSGEKPI